MADGECTHISKLGTVGAWTKIWKDECVLCFDHVKSKNGVSVCLTCFRGGCQGALNHSYDHFKRSTHPLILNIKRVQIEKPPEEKKEITKLAIGGEGGAALDDAAGTWEDEFEARCLECNKTLEVNEGTELAKVVDAVKNTSSATMQKSVKSWEHVITDCEHTLLLEQDANAPKLAVKKLAHCGECDLNNNLWLCLTCGHLGCGRKYADGSGGNNHAVDHTKATGHHVVVKMGTVTAEGTADIFCYACDDAKKDPKLKAHFAHLGIDLSAQEKTEKSTGELELEQNLKLDFTTKEDGELMEAMFGPGYTGFINIGNSCYLASVLQNLFNLKPFQERYVPSAQDHHAACGSDPAECWHCQVGKLADGLFSGRYSQKLEKTVHDHKNDKDDIVSYQEAIAPRMFKSLVAGNHEDFAGIQQQDAYEYYQFLLGKIQQKEATTGADPSNCLRYKMQQRIQCTACKKVRYSSVDQTDLLMMLDVAGANPPLAAAPEGEKPDERMAREQLTKVSLEKCAANVFSPTNIAAFNCPHCNSKTVALKSFRLENSPSFLATTMQRQDSESWVPRKMHLSVEMPEGSILDLRSFVAPATPPADEELLPEDAPAKPELDQAAVDQLTMMDVPRNRAERAVFFSGNKGAEAAMEWLFSHMDDPDIDQPLNVAGTQAASDDVSPEHVQTLIAIAGASESKARRALKETGNDIERAVDWVFSHMDEPDDDGAPAAAVPVDERPAVYSLVGIVEHRGTSPQSGHYVAYLKKQDKWVQYNDSRVHVSLLPPFHKAYMYFWQKTAPSSSTASGTPAAASSSN